MSFNRGTSLKGYEWVDEEGNAIMYFTFKDVTIHIIQDTTKDELDKFRQFLKKSGWNESGINFHWHTVEGYLDSEGDTNER